MYNVEFNCVMWALILSVLTFTAGLLLPEYKKRRNVATVIWGIEGDWSKVTYSKKVLLGVMFIPGLIYFPMELYIYFTDKECLSWTKGGPWWAVVLLVGIDILLIWLFIGFGITLLAAVTGIGISLFVLNVKAYIQNEKDRKLRSYIRAFRKEIHKITKRDIATIDAMCKKIL